MEELGGLLLNGPDHAGMTMTGVRHGNPGREIEKLIPVRIFDPDSSSAFGD